MCPIMGCGWLLALGVIAVAGFFGVLAGGKSKNKTEEK